MSFSVFDYSFFIFFVLKKPTKFIFVILSSVRDELSQSVFVCTFWRFCVVECWIQVIHVYWSLFLLFGFLWLVFFWYR